MYNAAEEAIKSLKNLIEIYYQGGNNPRPYEEIVKFPNKTRHQMIVEVLGNLVCDCRLLAEKENVNWEEIKSYSQNHFEHDKHLVQKD